MADDRAEHRAARLAERLEARELRLHGDASRAGGVDQRAAVRDHSRRGCSGGRALLPRGGRALLLDGAREPLLSGVRDGPQRGGVGIEAEDELRLALVDARGERVAEAQLQCPFTALFRPLPAVKRGTREAAI